jgi:hypothetical protein
MRGRVRDLADVPVGIIDIAHRGAIRALVERIVSIGSHVVDLPSVPPGRLQERGNIIHTDPEVVKRFPRSERDPELAAFGVPVELQLMARRRVA